MAEIKDTPAARFWAKVRKEENAFREWLTPCWVWIAGTTHDGYGNWGNIRAHRFSWELHKGPIPDGLCVLHRCDNPPCVRPEHLFLGTRADNMADRLKKGRGSFGALGAHKKGMHARGEAHCRAKLTRENVLEIRATCDPATRRRGDLSRLARKFGVDRASIRDVMIRRSWKHV